MEDTTKRVTKEQKCMLIQYMEDHREFAHDRFVNSAGAKSLSEEWDALAQMLNASGGACKSGELWKRAWVNMRGKAKQKYQDHKNDLERSGINGPQKNKITELDERVLGVMTQVAVVAETEVAEPLRVAELVPEVVLLRDEDDVDPRPSCSATTANKNVASSRKRRYDADAPFLAVEKELLREKRSKNGIAEAHVNALNRMAATLDKILEKLPENF